MRGGVQPIRAAVPQPAEVFAELRYQADQQNAKDLPVADRAKRLAELRALPVFADIADLSIALYVKADAVMKQSTGEARAEAIGGMKILEEFWNRFEVGVNLGRLAMARIVERQVTATSLRGETMTR